MGNKVVGKSTLEEALETRIDEETAKRIVMACHKTGATLGNSVEYNKKNIVIGAVFFGEGKGIWNKGASNVERFAEALGKDAELFEMEVPPEMHYKYFNSTGKVYDIEYGKITFEVTIFLPEFIEPHPSPLEKFTSTTTTENLKTKYGNVRIYKVNK